MNKDIMLRKLLENKHVHEKHLTQGAVAQACSGETEAGGSRVQGQPELHSETLSEKKKKKGTCLVPGIYQ
jgi:hypothetical protein